MESEAKPYFYIIKRVTPNDEPDGEPRFYSGYRGANTLPAEYDLLNTYPTSSIYIAMAIDAGAEFEVLSIEEFNTTEEARAREIEHHAGLDVARSDEWYNKMNAPLGFAVEGMPHYKHPATGHIGRFIPGTEPEGYKPWSPSTGKTHYKNHDTGHVARFEPGTEPEGYMPWHPHTGKPAYKHIDTGHVARFEPGTEPEGYKPWHPSTGKALYKHIETEHVAQFEPGTEPEGYKRWNPNTGKPAYKNEDTGHVAHFTPGTEPEGYMPWHRNKEKTHYKNHDTGNVARFEPGTEPEGYKRWTALDGTTPVFQLKSTGCTKVQIPAGQPIPPLHYVQGQLNALCRAILAVLPLTGDDLNEPHMAGKRTKAFAIHTLELARRLLGPDTSWEQLIAMTEAPPDAAE